MRIQPVAKTVLVNDRNEILLLRRSPTDVVRPGTADFPGGSVDPGEDIMEAAVREIKEESGLIIERDAIKLAYAKTSPPSTDGTILIRLLFIAKSPPNPEVQLSYEHDKYWWHPLSETMEEMDHTAWADGLEFIKGHQLLALL
ncbi:MAG: GDP-mannose mannosyl hydrolase [Candidatus Saccharibacteria bacterium]|nr:GDP-mannose mannosyl hydrolase [Candidatus Saccharibacteria bacterium]